MPTKCPKCDLENPSGSKFCKECGAQLISSKEVSEVTKTLQTPLASPGKTIAGKYKILNELGRGGMGVVYKAKDTRLKRTLALKFLPAELTQDKVAKDRFIQEAQAAAALNHPNITVIHEVDEADGQSFIAMEYIEGQSLKDKLKAGHLEIDEAKDIAIQVAEGLREAHEKGIVHRDIKPANVMLTKRGHVKITDFGLAKLSWGVDLTKTSTIVGTVAYMSPEQAKGEDVDHRTDIWSLGAMFYEMLTGERPFQKSQEQALIYAILNDKATPISLLRSDIPTHIEQVIDKAIAKKASERYQNIQELIQDLKLAIAFPKAEKSIAVLPFSDMSPQKDQEYFCDGIAEELINALTHIIGLHVAARTSAFSFKGKDVDIGEIGRKLKVDMVLEGSVRTAGNKLRVTAQLINVKDGYHLWSERYDREMEDVFDIQDEITQSIVEALRLKLEIGTEATQEKRHTKKLKAYHLYLKGRYFLYSRNERDLEKAIRHFEQAIDEDPSYTLPYAGLAESYCFIGGYGYLPPTVAFSKAKTAVEQALDIDESLAEVHAAMGLVRFWGQWDWHGAELEFKRAIDIKPTYVDVYCWYAILLFALERQEEAMEMIKRALELDPLSHFAYAVSGGLPFATRGQYEEGIEDLKKAIQYYPDYIYALWLLGHIYSLCSMHKEAIAAHQKVLALSGRASFYLGSIGMTYGLSGDLDKAKAILRELEERYQREYVPAFSIAHVWAGMKKPDQTFEWLEKAYNERASMIWMLGMQLWDPFRSDPRFEDLLHRLNLSWKS